jgi:hypothetical protein
MGSARAYEDEVAAFFREQGYAAHVRITLAGVRSKHNVDVWVTYEMAGYTQKCVVECKNWRTRVTKEKVLALRATVDDLGASVGFLVAESGFQPGAVAAAEQTNITLATLAELRERTGLGAADPLGRPFAPLRLVAGDTIGVELVAGGHHLAVEALPDSGAQTCIAPLAIARDLGLDLSQMRKVTTQSPLGTAITYEAEIDLRYDLPDGSGTHRWTVPFSFAAEVSSVVLGRRGFFDQFIIELSGSAAPARPREVRAEVNDESASPWGMLTAFLEREFGPLSELSRREEFWTDSDPEVIVEFQSLVWRGAEATGNRLARLRQAGNSFVPADVGVGDDDPRKTPVLIVPSIGFESGNEDCPGDRGWAGIDGSAQELVSALADWNNQLDLGEVFLIPRSLVHTYDAAERINSAFRDLDFSWVESALLR